MWSTLLWHNVLTIYSINFLLHVWDLKEFLVGPMAQGIYSTNEHRVDWRATIHARTKSILYCIHSSAGCGVPQPNSIWSTQGVLSCSSQPLFWLGSILTSIGKSKRLRGSHYGNVRAKKTDLFFIDSLTFDKDPIAAMKRHCHDAYTLDFILRTRAPTGSPLSMKKEANVHFWKLRFWSI